MDDYDGKPVITENSGGFAYSEIDMSEAFSNILATAIKIAGNNSNRTDISRSVKYC